MCSGGAELHLLTVHLVSTFTSLQTAARSDASFSYLMSQTSCFFVPLLEEL